MMPDILTNTQERGLIDRWNNSRYYDFRWKVGGTFVGRSYSSLRLWEKVHSDSIKVRGSRK
jgi:hypothetical protein